MKKSILVSLILLFAWSCEQIEPEFSGIGEVTFKSVAIESFSGNTPNARIAGPSSWKHVFKNHAVLELKNKVTGEEYKFDYDPNLFGEGFKISLPYGSYSYKTKVSGGAFEKYLPFRAEGEFNLGVASLEVSIKAVTDYGLITVKNEYVKSLGIRHGSELCEFRLLPDKSFFFLYAKKDQVAKLEIIESLTEKLLRKDVQIDAYNHYNFLLKPLPMNGEVNFIELALGVFEYVEQEIGIGDGLVFWNKLGSVEEVTNSEVGPNLVLFDEGDGFNIAANREFVEGKIGNGITIAPGDDYYSTARIHNLVLNNLNSVLNPDRGTISVWFFQKETPFGYDHNPYRIFDGPYGFEAGIGLSSFDDSNEGKTNVLLFELGKEDSYVSIKYDDFNKFNNQWVHIAAVWDRDGIAGSNETMQLLINGEKVVSTTENNWSSQFGDRADIAGANDIPDGKFILDEIKIFNFAKTNF